jgi:hypothetical protein
MEVTPTEHGKVNTTSSRGEAVTLVQVKTPTSHTFDETFKKLSKHDQIKGFPNYKDAKNRLNSAMYSLNAVKGYTEDSMESYMASRDPNTWKELFANVYRKKVPPLTPTEINSLKILSIELAKTDPSIFPEVRQHPSLSPDDGLLMAHNPHNAMLRGAGELWGHIWHLFPPTPSPNNPTTNAWKNKLVINPYTKKTSTPTTLKEAPLPAKRSYGELVMLKPCLPFESDFQTREKQQQEICTRLLLCFSIGINQRR